jgi:hypothetical protein
VLLAEGERTGHQALPVVADLVSIA